MHELSIGQSLLDLIAEHVPPHRRPYVRVVRLRVGELSGVVPESLEFCFEALVAGTPLAGARLEIERVPIRLRCDACRLDFPVAAVRLSCPSCGGTAARTLAGTELDLEEVELEDRVAEAS
jgi:hydrogenase nickel incorporation protein HypA/HybF